MLTDKKNDIWFISRDKELVHYNTYEKKSRKFPLEKILSPKGIITAFFKDRSHNIWLGTNRQGIQKFSPNRALFAHYVQDLKNPLVTSFAEDKNGNTFIGTFGGGLHKFDAKRKSVKNISQSPAYISSLLNDQEEYLWIGTANGHVFNKDLTGKKKLISHFTIGANIRDILRWGDNLFLASDGKGFFRYNLKSIKLHTFPINTTGSGTSSSFVWTLHRDKSNKLWLGMAAGGLNMFDPQSEKFEYFLDDPQNKKALNNKTVNTIYEDKQGKLWFGTYSGGLNFLNTENLEFSAITQNDGLSGNMITGILPGKNNVLWLATNNGLTKFNPLSGQSKFYDINDGLQSNEFFPGAALKSSDGHMYFGGINGFNVFNPDSINKNPNPPGILITHFQVHNQPDSLISELHQLPMTGGETINLDYNQNYITFEFSATDYTAPIKNHFAYKLEPIDLDFLYIGKRHHASYNNLDPGEYYFTVKASNNDGVWNEQGITIKLIISPPFWQTAWFYLFSSIAIVGLTIIYHRKRVRYKLKRALEIERIREEEQTKIRIKTARDFHDEMGHRLTRISMLTELILRKETSETSEFKYLLSQISDNANNLYFGARDFIWAIDPRNDSFFEMAIRMKDFGDELFDSIETDFRVEGIEGSLEEINMSMDLRRQIPLIFKEAMTNILKHANAKNVLLHFDVNDNNCFIKLEDDGNGFNLQTASAGLGLGNMKDRAKKIDAILTIKSQPEEGTQISCASNFTHTAGLLVNGEKSKVNHEF